LLEYRCRRCGRKFEILTGVIKEKVVCPDCQSVDAEKVVSVTGKPVVK
jgi:putative FmdB family regulatory protein